MANGVLNDDIVLVHSSSTLDVRGTQRIHRDVLPYLIEAAGRFYARTGRRLVLAEGWRSIATQESYFRDRYRQVKVGGAIYWASAWWVKKAGKAAAAKPGESNHGDGVAGDLWSGIDASFKSAEHKAFAEIAADLGWYCEGANFGEPWHWKWERARVRTRIDVASSNYTPIPELERALTKEVDTVIILHSTDGQGALVPDAGHVAFAPGEEAGMKVLQGAAPLVLEIPASLHRRIRLQVALRSGSRVLFLVDGGGYALLEDRKLSVVTDMNTVNALTEAQVATVPITGAQFDALAKDFG